MGTPSDAQRILTESELASLAKLKRPRRAGWAKLGYLRAAPKRGKYGELDAIELAAFHTLVTALDFDDAVLAWEDVRSSVREAALSGGPILVLFDHQAKEAVVADDPAVLGAHLRPGHLFELVNLTAAIGEIRRAYRKIRAAREARRGSDQSSSVESHEVGER